MPIDVYVWKELLIKQTQRKEKQKGEEQHKNEKMEIKIIRKIVPENLV
jgi:hypothetical protein